jgi:hypothetical protein
MHSTATVTAGNAAFDSDDTATATIFTLALVTTDCGVATAGTGIVGTDYGLAQGTILVYVDNSLGTITPDEQTRIADAIATDNTQLDPYGLNQVEVGPDEAANASITIIGDFLTVTEFGGLPPAC